jgi:hypothetical protein
MFVKIKMIRYKSRIKIAIKIITKTISLQLCNTAMCVYKLINNNNNLESKSNKQSDYQLFIYYYTL